MHGAPAAIVAGRLASPARVCAGSRSPLPTPSAAGSRTIPLCVASSAVVDVAALVLADVVVLPPEAPEQNVDEPSTPIEGGVACDADPDMVGNEPRPVVPRPLVPRPLVPRAAASSELTELDERGGQRGCACARGCRRHGAGVTHDDGAANRIARGRRTGSYAVRAQQLGFSGIRREADPSAVEGR
jgi:hypothetical protein